MPWIFMNHAYAGKDVVAFTSLIDAVPALTIDPSISSMVERSNMQFVSPGVPDRPTFLHAFVFIEQFSQIHILWYHLIAPMLIANQTSHLSH
jgi:hypothetical protein